MNQTFFERIEISDEYEVSAELAAPFKLLLHEDVRDAAWQHAAQHSGGGAYCRRQPASWAVFGPETKEPTPLFAGVGSREDWLVGEGGLEPPRPFGHRNLKIRGGHDGWCRPSLLGAADQHILLGLVAADADPEAACCAPLGCRSGCNDEGVATLSTPSSLAPTQQKRRGWCPAARRSGKLTRGELRTVIGDVWSAEWPAAALGQREWISLFRTAGFVADDGRQVPAEPMKVYRGSTWGRRRGMSWTEDRARAEWFAARWNARETGAGLVFETTVQPEAVLALIGIEGGRDEAEVVVDPAMLPPILRPR